VQRWGGQSGRRAGQPPKVDRGGGRGGWRRGGRNRGVARGRGESSGGSGCAGPRGFEHWAAQHHGGEAMRAPGGADPLVRAGPSGPALRSKDQVPARQWQADGGVGRGTGGPPRQSRFHPAAACLLLALILAPAAYAQFDLFLLVGGAEQAAPAVYDFGSLYAGESAVAHFRLRNTSSAVATVNV